MLHPDVTLGWVDDVIGYGLFATRLIPLGTITWVQDRLDQVFDPSGVGRLGSAYHEIIEKYTWLNREGNRILCWDLARFMNHNCDANTFSPGFDFEIAVRDIQAGDQVTSDYGALNVETPLACTCGAPSCRGVVVSEDFETYAPRWDELVRLAFPHIPRVDQPLWPLVSEKTGIAAGVRNPDSIPSILSHRFPCMATNGHRRNGNRKTFSRSAGS